MILATKDFSHMQIRTVGTLVPERGYSSFKFVPGTHDNVVMAVKSVEDSANDTQVRDNR